MNAASTSFKAEAEKPGTETSSSTPKIGSKNSSSSVKSVEITMEDGNNYDLFDYLMSNFRSNENVRADYRFSCKPILMECYRHTMTIHLVEDDHPDYPPMTTLKSSNELVAAHMHATVMGVMPKNGEFSVGQTSLEYATAITEHRSIKVGNKSNFEYQAFGPGYMHPDLEPSGKIFQDFKSACAFMGWIGLDCMSRDFNSKTWDWHPLNMGLDLTDSKSDHLLIWEGFALPIRGICQALFQSNNLRAVRYCREYMTWAIPFMGAQKFKCYINPADWFSEETWEEIVTAHPSSFKVCHALLISSFYRHKESKNAKKAIFKILEHVEELYDNSAINHLYSNALLGPSKHVRSLVFVDAIKFEDKLKKEHENLFEKTIWAHTPNLCDRTAPISSLAQI